MRSNSSSHDAEAIFRVQKSAKGNANADSCASEDLNGEVIIVVADILFDSKEKVSVEGADSVIWLKEVEDPSRFGVAVYQGDEITDFVEKPSEPISNLAIIGVYYFRKGEELMKEIQYLLDNNVQGHGGEYQLTDALDRMLKDGKLFKKATVDEWLDCGTLPAWLDTTAEILKKENESHPEIQNNIRHKTGFIAEGVTLSDSEIGHNVSIEKVAVITNRKSVV